MSARVFIGASKAAISIAEYAQAELTYVSLPEIWTNGNFPSQFTPIEALFSALSKFDFAVFICLPEDTTTKSNLNSSTMRDNVLFEIGLFLGRLGRERVFLIAPSNTFDTTLTLPSDLTGVQPSFYAAEAPNLRAAVGISLHEMKSALKAFSASRLYSIFDSRVNLKSYQLVRRGGKKYNELGTGPISGVAEGSAVITDTAIELKRSNSEGVYQIEIRPNGKNEPSIAQVPTAARRFEVKFDARIENTSHNLRVVFVDNKFYNWLDDELFVVSSQNWNSYVALLKVSPTSDVLLRIDDEIDTLPSGKLYIRNIIVTQL